MKLLLHAALLVAAVIILMSCSVDCAATVPPQRATKRPATSRRDSTREACRRLCESHQDYSPRCLFGCKRVLDDMAMGRAPSSSYVGYTD